MKVQRSASQVLFGYLPEQTVDINRGIWKVRQWRNATRLGDVDSASLTRELKRIAAPWRATGMDGGFCQSLDRGAVVNVLALERFAGVQVEVFPDVWFCAGCHRILDSFDQPCSCGTRTAQQIHFVGYCEQCGTLREPGIRRCRTHRAARVNFPGTASASEITFDCPDCSQVLQRGFGFPRCACGETITFNVHRAASVFTPRCVVIVNPPSRTQIALLASAGGPAAALRWVLGGMKERSAISARHSTIGLREELLARGLAADLVDTMLKAAGSAVEQDEALDPPIPDDMLEVAQEQAVTVSLASLESRVTIEDLIDGTDPMSPLGSLYRDRYRTTLRQAGLEAVELIDKFPVLTGHFGYTRGQSTPGASRLVAYRERNGFVVYGEIAQTEALFVRLDPAQVVAWLRSQGFDLGIPRDNREARIEILRRAVIPSATDETGTGTPGEALLTLIHSYAHRFIRITAVAAGIELSSLSELIVPLHLGFYVYAAARGDFVLGGLQALFESELDYLLSGFTFDELRCPLDPGCMKSGGACMACIHLGEPSCRYFNRFLSRSVLMGPHGYFSMAGD